MKHGKHMNNKQTGGTIVGFILGLLVGLGVALGVAVYVTKLPVPFLNKGATRSSDQDNAERQKEQKLGSQFAAVWQERRAPGVCRRCRPGRRRCCSAGVGRNGNANARDGA